MQVVLSSHGAYHLKYHCVWVCKYRRKVLNPGVESTLRKLLPHLLRSMPGTSLETIGFDRDHLHFVMVIPPKYAIATVMGCHGPHILDTQSLPEVANLLT